MKITLKMQTVFSYFHSNVFLLVIMISSGGRTTAAGKSSTKSFDHLNKIYYRIKKKQ